MKPIQLDLRSNKDFAPDGGLVLLSVILIWKNCIYYFSRQANCLLLSFKTENIFQTVKPGPAG